MGTTCEGQEKLAIEARTTDKIKEIANTIPGRSGSEDRPGIRVAQTFSLMRIGYCQLGGLNAYG